MKSIHWACLIGLAAVTAFMVGAAEDGAIEKDLAKLQGEWAMVSGSADGQPLPEARVRQMKRVCKGNDLTVTGAGGIFLKAKITIDPSKNPKTIDYDVTDGVAAGKKTLGIYEIDGETFKACFGKPGGERPADFTSKAGEGRTMSVWKRQKATAPAGGQP